MTLKSKHEKSMHSAMMAHDVGSGVGRGALGGALTALAARKAGVKLSPGGAAALTAAGAIGGGATGAAKGKARAAKDTVQQQRMDYRYHRMRGDRNKDYYDRRNARMEKKSYDAVMMSAFADELSKSAGILGTAGKVMSTVGNKVMGGAGQLAKKTGYGKQFGKLRGQVGRSMGGQDNLAKTVGVGTAALGAGAVGGAALSGGGN